MGRLGSVVVTFWTAMVMTVVVVATVSKVIRVIVGLLSLNLLRLRGRKRMCFLMKGGGGAGCYGYGSVGVKRISWSGESPVLASKYLWSLDLLSGCFWWLEASSEPNFLSPCPPASSPKHFGTDTLETTCFFYVHPHAHTTSRYLPS